MPNRQLPATSNQQLAPSPLLHKALDRLYASGPGAEATARAQVKLRDALSAAQARDVFYDLLPSTPIGQVFVAVNTRGVVAVGFGITERAFVAVVQRKPSALVTRSPQK